MDKELNSKFDNQQVEDERYRSVSKTALACLVFAVFSLLAFLSEPLLILPVISIACGLMAISNLRRFPDELLGKTAVKIGLSLSLFCFVAAIAMYVIIFMTEVPDGYERISFRSLRDDTKTRLPYSEFAEELDGKKVFVRCYVRPGSKTKNLDEFIAVGNFGDCCFGGTEKPSDVIGVRILTGDTVNYSLRLRRVAGTFRLNRKAVRTGESQVPSVFYQIDADYIR